MVTGNVKEGSLLDGFLGKTVEVIAPMTPKVPPPQDATAVASLLDGLRDHNCSLVTAIKHKLSVIIDEEPMEKELVYEPPVVQGNLRKTGLHHYQETNANSEEDMCYYMTNIIRTAEQMAENERKIHGSGRDFVYWKKCKLSTFLSAFGHTAY